MDSYGFTLIELIIVIAVISILALVTFPTVIVYIEKSNEAVCNFNCLELVKDYNVYLEIENIQHSESLFIKFIEEYDVICPRYGEITYKDRKVKCRIHSGEDKDEEIPYL